MVTEILWALFNALLGAAVSVSIQVTISYWKAHHGFLTGSWEQIIYDSNGSISKKDKIRLRHEGNIIKGSVKRVEPANQNMKEWQLHGRIEGHMLFCIFWSKDLRKNPGSYGTIQMHMINQSKFTGFYVRLEITNSAPGFSETLTPTNLEWLRVI